MAQSLTVTPSNPYLRADMEEFNVICDWQGDADTVVSMGIAVGYANNRYSSALKAPFPQRLVGKIARVETRPGAAGDISTYIPNGTYALTLLDQYGYDLLDGTGVARSISAVESVVFDTPIPINGEITLTVSSTATTDRLAGDGAFSSVANWTLGAGWSDTTGEITKGAGTGTVTHAGGSAFAAISGRKYDVTYTIGSWSTAANRGLKVTCGGVDGTTRTADGTYTDTITATGTGGLIFTPTGSDATGVVCTLDDVTVKYANPSGRCVIYFVK
jgi:hypothetical protein